MTTNKEVIEMAIDKGGREVDIKELDAQLQKKSVKLVVMHLKKKLTPDMSGTGPLLDWIDDMEELLEQEGFDKPEYFDMRKKLYDAIEWVPDTEARQRLRNSWYSYGKALNKKAPRHSDE